MACDMVVVVVAKGWEYLKGRAWCRGGKRTESAVLLWCVKVAGVCGQIGDGILFEETDRCAEAMSRT
jgi:hypothetical protein